jgi:predicted PurR-regulated permease PerM
MEEEENAGEKRMESLLGAAGLFLLLLGCFFVLRPFLSALIWAIVLAYSLWPLQQRFTRWFRGRRTPAAMLVTLTMMVVSVGPFVLIGYSIADDAKALGAATRRWVESAPDEPPAWVHKVPVMGDELTAYWHDFADDRRRWIRSFDDAIREKQPPRPKIATERGDEVILTEPPAVPSMLPPDSAPVQAAAEATVEVTESSRLAERFAGQLGQAAVWVKRVALSTGKVVGQGLIEVALSVFLAFFLLRDGATLAERLATGMWRIAGEQGRHLVQVAGGTVRGVIYGILGTAFAQAIVAGIGFSIAGVPGAVLLAMLTFFSSPVPIGPPLIWIPATIWLFTQGSPGWGIFMALWGALGISGVDNIVKPFVISHESKTPFVLIFCGVIGGALAFGLVGVFLGPTLLAVTFRLIEEWSAKRKTSGIITPDSPVASGGD